MRVTHDSITDTDNLVALIQGSSFPVVLGVLILEREENRSTRRKTLEAQERSTMVNFNSHESPIHDRHRPDLTWLFSEVRGTMRYPLGHPYFPKLLSLHFCFETPTA